MSLSSGLDRRTLLRSTGTLLAGASLSSAAAAARVARGGQDDTLNIALVGCGGRGTGAAAQALNTGNVRLVACADAYSDRLEGALGYLQQSQGDKVQVPVERRFTGFDAYQKAIDSDVDLVILTTPPGFRPIHFEYAVERGRHVFMEKPVAVDPVGVRRVVRAAQSAKEQGLKVGVGLQRHHSVKYKETVGRIHAGELGDLRLLRCYWNSSGVWVKPRQEGQGEMDYQMRNWYYFNWLCGDHITEQHIHNLDVCNWVMKGYPVTAQGQGGRQVRKGSQHGEIFDHHMVEYTYGDGTKMLSQCRHIPSTWSSVSEHVTGTLGSSNVGRGQFDIFGGEGWRFRGEDPDPYQVEHDVLFRAIREGLEHNEAENGAYSTMTSILGRMATYSGQEVQWDAALASELDLSPGKYAFDAEPPVLPGTDGLYAIPTPGTTAPY